MHKQDVWEVAIRHRSEIVGKLQSFANVGVDVEGIYDEVALHLSRGDTSKLDTRLPGLLYDKTRKRCLDYLARHGNDPKRRVSYDSDAEPEAQFPEVLRVEVEAAERAWQIAESRLDRDLLLRRLPQDLAQTVMLHDIDGYTLDETATRRHVSVSTVRRDLQEATTALEWIVEHEGRLPPREYVESPRHKAAREAIERRCAQLRPVATKPTLGRTKKLDPRTFMFSTATIAWFEWIAEVEARIKRGERLSHAKRQPLRSIDHKMADLIVFAERTKETPSEQMLPLAA
jgi:DNA-directed RNA polymerase specialized sigma24 family protein